MTKKLFSRSATDKIMKRIQKSGGIISKPEDRTDFLTIDPEMEHQRYFVFSYILSDTPEMPMMFKCRGAFKTFEQAQEHSRHLQKQDKYYNIYIGEVGKWTSCLTPEGLERNDIQKNYAEDKMNEIIQKYHETEKKNKEHHLQRRELAISRSRTLSYIQRILNFLQAEGENSEANDVFDWKTLKFNDTETDEYFTELTKKYKFKNINELEKFLTETKADIEKMNAKYHDDFKLNKTDLEKTIKELTDRLKYLESLENKK